MSLGAKHMTLGMWWLGAGGVQYVCREESLWSEVARTNGIEDGILMLLYVAKQSYSYLVRLSRLANPERMRGMNRRRSKLTRRHLFEECNYRTYSRHHL